LNSGCDSIKSTSIAKFFKAYANGFTPLNIYMVATISF
jgi:hypothetical protein